MTHRSICDDYTAALARIDELEAALAAEKEGRRNAEAKLAEYEAGRDAFKVHFAGDTVRDEAQAIAETVALLEKQCACVEEQTGHRCSLPKGHAVGPAPGVVRHKFTGTVVWFTDLDAPKETP